MSFYQKYTWWVFFPSSACIILFSPGVFIKGWIMVLIFGRLDRRKQNKLSLVATFSCRIGFCEARSDTAHCSWVSFPTFHTRETDTQKKELVYESDQSIGKEEYWGFMFSRLLLWCSCYLERTMVEYNTNSASFFRSLHDTDHCISTAFGKLT